ncbi:hypothetical protein L7F22_010441 [Adiantum nelumboides]|nr:hypothetical protein [Adiantum nelumboides]
MRVPSRRRERSRSGGRSVGEDAGGAWAKICTRDLFSRPFKQKGYIPLTTYLRTYKIGDYVDIKVNGSVHKSMPHKIYHGCTGVILNITKHAIGMEMNKQVNTWIVKKRIHMLIEHVAFAMP